MLKISSKKNDSLSHFKIFLTGCRLFAILKVLVALLVTNLKSITKYYFF